MSWKVLVLDDNARSASELHHGLSEVGCDVQVIADKRTLAAAKSISRLSSDAFDAILVSIVAPRLTGLSLFDRIHRDTRRRGIPVILVSSDASVLAEHEASPTPAEGYVRKPADHDAFVAELGAQLLAVVGAGTRTVPPPPPDTGETGVADKPLDAETPEMTVARPSLREPPASKRNKAHRSSPSSASHPSVRSPEQTVSAVVRLPAPPREDDDEQASRIVELETELRQSLELLKAAGKQLEADRTAHEEALAAAATEAEDRLAEERAMGESALTSMAAELHAQSIKFGKRVAEATTRARDAEDRVKAERAGAVSTLSAAEATLSAKQRELIEMRDSVATAAKRTAALEEQLRAAEETLRALEDRHGEDRARLTTKLAAAASAFDRKQRELVETRETATKLAAVLDEELRLARTVRDTMTRDLEAERSARDVGIREAEEKLRAALERHAEERASAASAERDAAAARDAVEGELKEEREATTKRLEAKDEELTLARATHDELAAQYGDLAAQYESLTREREELRCDIDAERESHVATAAAAAAEYHALRDADEKQLAEERAAAAVALEAAHQEIIETRAARERQTEIIEEARSASAEARGEEQARSAAAEALVVVKQRELLETRAAATMQTEFLEEELRALREKHEGLAAERAELQRELEAERISHGASAAAETESEELRREVEQRLTAERDQVAATLDEAEKLSEATRQELFEAREAAEAVIKALEEEREEERSRARAELESLAVETEQLRRDLEVERASREANAAAAAMEAEGRERAEVETAALRLAVTDAETVWQEAEQRLLDDRARAASALAAAEATSEAIRRDLLEAHQRVAAEERRAAEIVRANVELEGRLQREAAMRRSDHELALTALRAAEERIATLESRASAPPSSRVPTPAPSDSGLHRTPRRTVLPDESRASAYPRERRSSGPPPVESGSRIARLPASLEGDRDDSRPVDRRAVLVIDGDRVARVNTVRALARASCEVTVRDSCADVGAELRTFDVIVTEVVGVAIEELLNACRERPQACAVVAWTQAVDSARAMFDGAEIKRTTVLQKGSRADGLVAAVRSHLDDTVNVAHG